MILSPKYTLEQLRAWLKSKLAGQLWRLEAMSPAFPQTLDDAISQALWEYSESFPKFAFERIPSNTTSHEIVHPNVVGVWNVDFIAPYNVFGIQSNYMSNLTGVVAPALSGYITNLTNGETSSEVEMFLQWSKSFQRVTSRKPDWKWNEESNRIVIHNPINYEACAYLCTLRDSIDLVKLNHRNMFAQLALAHAQVQLGQNRNKFSGDIPGPGGTTLKLNGDALIKEGNEALVEVRKMIRGRRPRLLPSFD